MAVATTNVDLAAAVSGDGNAESSQAFGDTLSPLHKATILGNDVQLREAILNH